MLTSISWCTVFVKCCIYVCFSVTMTLQPVMIGTCIIHLSMTSWVQSSIFDQENKNKFVLLSSAVFAQRVLNGTLNVMPILYKMIIIVCLQSLFYMYCSSLIFQDSLMLRVKVFHGSACGSRNTRVFVFRKGLLSWLPHVT